MYNFYSRVSTKPKRETLEMRFNSAATVNEKTTGSKYWCFIGAFIVDCDTQDMFLEIYCDFFSYSLKVFGNNCRGLQFIWAVLHCVVFKRSFVHIFLCILQLYFAIEQIQFAIFVDTLIFFNEENTSFPGFFSPFPCSSK